uniref:Branched-chain amino acid ABC transporter ATP-binding protein n=1 Tax=Caldiarchaeum subterraneum TaxID=311458 RepID=E6NBE9_CALS0|nr:branched-chain amino acid ABC transporter ATP-binding protein [Candidatus Caldarchaeum subterraneum]
MLMTQGLGAGYKKLQVLFDVSVTVPEKQLTVVVGPNGSGKSTFLKTIFGLTKIYSGKIMLDGVDITGLQPHEIAYHGISYVPQVDNIFSNLTVYENLLIATHGLDIDESAIDDVMEMFPHLKTYRNKKAALMSGGERQMLAIAMSLLRKPKIMLFDEPTGNLSPKMAITIFNIIKDLRENYGKTILLAEQNAKKALEIGDRAILLVSGKTVYQGDANALLTHEELGKLYLGIK